VPNLLSNRKNKQGIRDFLKLDYQVLSFGKFISGKTLGSTLKV